MKKNLTAIIIGIILVIGFLISCGSEQDKLQGIWETESGDRCIIINENKYILLQFNKEQHRGIFSLKTEKITADEEIKIIVLKPEYETLYLSGEKPFAINISNNNSLIDTINNSKVYNFPKSNLLTISGLGAFKKAKQPIVSVQDIEEEFKINLDNPDMRDTIRRNQKVYTTRIKISDLGKIANYKTFGEYATKREEKNGVFSNNVMNICLESVNIFSDNLRRFNGTLKEGNIITITYNDAPHISGNYIRVPYIGNDINIDTYSHPQLLLTNKYRIFGTLFFEDNNLNLEVNSITRN